MLKNFLIKIHLLNKARWVYKKTSDFKNIIRNFLFPTAIILTYHRVANISEDPHQLAVSPQIFHNQLKYLKENYIVISLDQLINHIKNRTVKRKMIVITFDDGYTDNLQNALPTLEKFEIPATIFVSSGHIDTRSFYWDDNADPVCDRPMTKAELAKISENKLISIGGHTLSHLHTPTLAKEKKITEIGEDKNKLEKYCNKEIKSFSFPFGEFDDESIKIAKDIGYECVCLLGEKRITNNTDIYHLPRFLVRNWDSKEFIRNIKYKFL